MYQRTVLIVEDEIVIRMMLADTLLDEGYDVVEAANVLEAVAVLGQRTSMPSSRTSTCPVA